jgi:uncharacterized protein YbjT (DUF2867 family)
LKEQFMSQAVITVFGATGAQGGGLARAILADRGRRFALRAATRNPDGEAARALARAGADVVVADLDDAGSVLRALEGAYGAFFLTNFWAHLSAERELTQAHIMASAAAQVGIRHAIWSTLEDTREFFPADGRRMPVLQGKYNVPHLDAKGEANRYFRQQRVPTTFLYTSGYLENLINFGLGPKRRADGRLAITFPTGEEKVPWIAAEDIGRSAFGIFARGESMIGESLGVAGDHITGGQLAAAIGAALGEPVDYDAVTPDQYRRAGFQGADEMGNMFQFKRDFAAPFCAMRDLDRSRALNPEMLSAKQWLAQNWSRLPLN